jgi:hypothetical protein
MLTSLILASWLLAYDARCFAVTYETPFPRQTRLFPDLHICPRVWHELKESIDDEYDVPGSPLPDAEHRMPHDGMRQQHQAMEFPLGMAASLRGVRRALVAHGYVLARISGAAAPPSRSKPRIRSPDR